MDNPIKQLTVRERSGLAVCAGTLAVLGLVGWAYRSAQSAPLTPRPSVSAAPVPERASPRAIVPTAVPESLAPRPTVVYVTGAVNAPGVYSLPAEARLYQAIHKAGGFRKGARREALNLAEHVRDADQIHVPTVAESAPGPAEPEPDPQAPAPTPGRVLGKPSPPADKKTKPEPKKAAAPGKLKKPGDGTIRLNTATAADLQRLPGVGSAMAERILEFRQKQGKFERIEQLGEVKGIGDKKLEKMKPFLTLD